MGRVASDPPHQLIVLDVTTRDPAQRTSAGLGVGTSAAKLDRVLPGNHCKVKNGRCGVGTLCGVRRSTDFQIRNGRVSEVSISIESSYDDGSLQAPNPVCRRS